MGAIYLFGQLSGYKISVSKSLACPLTIPAATDIHFHCPVQWWPVGCRYLEMHVTLLHKQHRIPMAWGCKKKKKKKERTGRKFSKSELINSAAHVHLLI